MRDALDAAWGDFPTNDIGFDWLRYTGSARPSKAWCDAVSQHSRITFIQESAPTRSQDGFVAGQQDCQYAEARAREVHPNVESIAVVVSDGNYADKWDASQYGAGWASKATLAFFPYGTPYICQSFINGAGTTPLNLKVTWVPETWGTGTAMSQVVGPSPIANTDLNHVHAPYWPTTGPTPGPGSHKELELVYQEKETGTYYAEGLGGFYGVEKAVGIGVGLNGGAVVPVTAAQMKKLGDDSKAQAVAFLKSVGLLT